MSAELRGKAYKDFVEVERLRQRVKELEAQLADESEVVVGPDGPVSKRSPYLHWRRRAEAAEAMARALDSDLKHSVARAVPDDACDPYNAGAGGPMDRALRGGEK